MSTDLEGPGRRAPQCSVLPACLRVSLFISKALEPGTWLPLGTATGFPEGPREGWAAGMFYTRQALEKQTRGWALCPLSRRVHLHTRTSVCLLFDKSVWICISVPKGQGPRQRRAEPERERVGMRVRPMRERERRGACVCVCVCVHTRAHVCLCLCICWGRGSGPWERGTVCLHVHACLCLCVVGRGAGLYLPFSEASLSLLCLFLFALLRFFNLATLRGSTKVQLSLSSFLFPEGPWVRG